MCPPSLGFWVLGVHACTCRYGAPCRRAMTKPRELAGRETRAVDRLVRAPCCSLVTTHRVRPPFAPSNGLRASSFAHMPCLHACVQYRGDCRGNIYAWVTTASSVRPAVTCMLACLPPWMHACDRSRSRQRGRSMLVDCIARSGESGYHRLSRRWRCTGCRSSTWPRADSIDSD